MSYTAVAPTSLNLNMFDKDKAKLPVFTDDEDIFSLDMVTMDMEFDQAYSMYTQMQQNHALSGVEQLQRAKAQRSQQQSQSFQNLQHQNRQSQPQPQFQLPYGPLVNQNRASFPEYTSYDSVPGLPLLLPPSESGGLFTGSKTANPMMQKDEDDSVDHFFLNTELNALEKFLDNLALLSLGNPLELYQQLPASPKMTSMYDLHTMEVRKDMDFKKDITDAFRHPPVQSLKSFGQKEHQTPESAEHLGADQLLTPMGSRQSSSSEKRSVSPPMLPSKKRRRSSTRPLLTLEQKRLNHSHSEQKRRLLCKQAYDRCLRLITNVDDYKNDLVSASAVSLSKKKSKRKQLNKDGLPNLLKHTALLKVSAEILKIKRKNEGLKKLLGM